MDTNRFNLLNFEDEENGNNFDLEKPKKKVLIQQNAQKKNAENLEKKTGKSNGILEKENKAENSQKRNQGKLEKAKPKDLTKQRNQNRDNQIEREPINAKGRNGQNRSRNFQENSRGKREHDRQSGSDKTGIKVVEKRSGAGSHNWGSVKQELAEIHGDVQSLLSKTEQIQGEGTTSPSQVPVPSQPEPKEEPKLFTLDEYKAQQELKRAKPKYNIRKAGEGEDCSQWNQMIALKPGKKNGNLDEEDEFEYDPSLYPQRVGRLQRIVDIQFNFNDNRRGGFGQQKFGRGRRGPGGAEGKGAEKPGERKDSQKAWRQRRDDKREQHAPKVDDVRQFPTLS